jgi:hypothetical protein
MKCDVALHALSLYTEVHFTEPLVCVSPKLYAKFVTEHLNALCYHCVILVNTCNKIVNVRLVSSSTEGI